MYSLPLGCRLHRARPWFAPREVVSTGVHFHRCVTEEVFVAGAHGQVRLATLCREVGEGLGVRAAEAAALRPEDLAAVQQQVRARVLRWFARAGHLDL